MANIVDFLVRIKDIASAPLQRIAGVGGNAFRQLENSVNRVTSRLGNLKYSIADIDRKLSDLQKTREISVDSRQIRRINREIAELEGRRNRLTNSGGGGGGFFGKALVFGGLAALGTLGVGALKNGMERQQAGTAFEVNAGAKDGAKLHRSLINFATDTIYGNEVFSEAQTMLGFGLAAKNVMPSLKMLGDVSLGNSERMKSLSLVFSQTAAAGKLSGQDLLQYISAGFNPLQVIYQKTGRSMADLKKDMEKGKITFQDVVGAFQYATGPMGRFHNGMQKMSETPTGKWMAFTGALQTFSGTIGVALLPALGAITSILTGLMNNEPLMIAIAAGIGAMAVAWGIYATVTNWAAICQALLNIAMFWPIALIGLIIGLVVLVAKRWDGWGKSIKALWEIIKSFCSIVGVTFKEFFQQLVFGFEMLWLKTKSTFQFITTTISNTIQALKLALSGKFDAAKAVLTAHITTDADREIDKLKRERAADQKANIMSVVSSVKNINDQWKNVGLTRSKTGGKSPLDSFSTDSKFDMKGVGGGAPTSSGSTNSAITGGGVRNITIIVEKFQDKTEIHTTTMKEGIAEIEDRLKEMFLRITNSAASTVS